MRGSSKMCNKQDERQMDGIIIFFFNMSKYFAINELIPMRLASSTCKLQNSTSILDMVECMWYVLSTNFIVRISLAKIASGRCRGLQKQAPIKNWRSWWNPKVQLHHLQLWDYTEKIDLSSIWLLGREQVYDSRKSISAIGIMLTSLEETKILHEGYQKRNKGRGQPAQIL